MRVVLMVSVTVLALSGVWVAGFLVGRQHPAEAQPRPSETIAYADGQVVYQETSTSSPSVEGQINVVVSEHYVRVSLSADPGSVLFIPRERVIYVGPHRQRGRQ